MAVKNDNYGGTSITDGYIYTVADFNDTYDSTYSYAVSFGGGTSFLPIIPNTVGQGTWIASANSGAVGCNKFENSSATDGDNCTFKLYLHTGIYTLNILYLKNDFGGIGEISLDGNNITTIDMYTSGTIWNNIVNVTSINVTTAGVKDLTLTVNGQNASSSSYVFAIQYVQVNKQE